jgi:hypothetical protein
VETESLKEVNNAMVEFAALKLARMLLHLKSADLKYLNAMLLKCALVALLLAPLTLTTDSKPRVEDWTSH